jgi:hypothetical protein
MCVYVFLNPYIYIHAHISTYVHTYIHIGFKRIDMVVILIRTWVA